jgi:cell division protein FtsW
VSARRAKSPPIEYSLMLTATLCLLAFGAVMVFSASSATSLLSDQGGDGAYFLKRTVLFGALGLLVMRLLSVRGAQLARAVTPVLLAVSMILLVAVLLPGIGQTANGAQRWIGAGLVTFQPSELAKVALILYGAHLLASEPKRIRSLRGLAPYLIVCALALVMIAREPDIGTASVAGVAIICLLVAGGVRLRNLAPLAAVIALIGLVMIATHPYQQARITGFLDPAADAEGGGFQGTQAAIALGSGGVLGVGLGESVQKAFYLPEAHTDMIAAVIGEEVGLLGIAVLIGLFTAFGWAGFRAAHRCRDRYGKLVAAGLTSLILTQAAVNLFAALGLAPLTGVPLPFVSYGGTSLTVTMAAVGLILNVAGASRAGAAASRSAGRANASRRRSTRVRRSAPERARTGGDASSAAKLRVLEGGPRTRSKEKRASGGTGRDSGGRHRGARRARHRGRRRAAR